MRGIVLIPALFLLASAHGAEVYKYTDIQGRIYFTDAPLVDKGLKLEWVKDEAVIDAEINASNKASNKASTKAPAPAATRKEERSTKVATRRGRFEDLIDTVAREERVHPALLHAVVRTESAYRVDAISPKGARGLMQLMPATARRYAVKDIQDPAENLRGGARYLRYLLDRFGNDVYLTLAAYNAGENAPALKEDRIPSAGETPGYVHKVITYLTDELRGLSPAAPPRPQALVQEPKTEGIGHENPLLAAFNQGARVVTDFFKDDRGQREAGFLE